MNSESTGGRRKRSHHQSIVDSGARFVGQFQSAQGETLLIKHEIPLYLAELTRCLCLSSWYFDSQKENGVTRVYGLKDGPILGSAAKYVSSIETRNPSSILLIQIDLYICSADESF
jgi:hypothetical protein